MKRELAKDLKAAGFPTGAYRSGHKFYPHEDDSGWTDAARRRGVIINPYTLENRLQDIAGGYYCPGLSDLIDACGANLARLFIVKTLWTAESDNPKQIAMGDSPEEAVGRLWLALQGRRTPEIRPIAQPDSQRGGGAAAASSRGLATGSEPRLKPPTRSAMPRSG